MNNRTPTIIFSLLLLSGLLPAKDVFKSFEDKTAMAKTIQVQTTLSAFKNKDTNIMGNFGNFMGNSPRKITGNIRVISFKNGKQEVQTYSSAEEYNAANLRGGLWDSPTLKDYNSPTTGTHKVTTTTNINGKVTTTTNVNGKVTTTTTESFGDNGFGNFGGMGRNVGDLINRFEKGFGTGGFESFGNKFGQGDKYTSYEDKTKNVIKQDYKYQDPTKNTGNDDYSNPYKYKVPDKSNDVYQPKTQDLYSNPFKDKYNVPDTKNEVVQPKTHDLYSNPFKNDKQDPVVKNDQPEVIKPQDKGDKLTPIIPEKNPYTPRTYTSNDYVPKTYTDNYVPKTYTNENSPKTNYNSPSQDKVTNPTSNNLPEYKNPYAKDQDTKKIPIKSPADIELENFKAKQALNDKQAQKVPEKVNPVVQKVDEKKPVEVKEKIETPLIIPNKDLGGTKDNKYWMVRDDEFSQLKTKGFRPIKIVFEDSLLRDSLRQILKGDLFERVKDLIRKTDSFIRTHIWTQKEEKEITVPKNFVYCEPPENDVEEKKHYYIKKERITKELKTKGDLYIFLTAFYDSDSSTLAAAKPCGVNRKDGSTDIGMLKMNMAHLFTKESENNRLKQFNALRTIVHEVLHIIAFHSAIMQNYENKVDSKFPHLYYFKKHPYSAMDSTQAHWNQLYLTNDLMAPTERVDSILSAFTLEYIQLANPGYITIRSYTENNFVLSAITNFNDFLNYKCPETGIPKYENFCSPEQYIKQTGLSCHSNYLYMTTCASTKYSNGCVERRVYSFGNCQDETLADDKNKDESSFGINSRCWLADGMPLCQNARVAGNKMFLVGPKGEYECKYKGEKLKMVTPSPPGTISSIGVLCPDPADFIAKWKIWRCEDNCNGNGLCREGKCYCFDGYSQETNCKYPAKTSWYTTFITSL